METPTAIGRYEAWRRPGTAFAVCFIGSLGLVGYGVATGALEINLLLGCLVALGLVAGLVAPSLAGFGSALAGGWVGLLGYAIAYLIVSGGIAEAGFYSGQGILLATVVVPFTVAPGFLPGALVARWSSGGGRWRSRVPVAVGLLVLVGAVGALSASAMDLSDGGGSVSVTVGSDTVTYMSADCGEWIDGRLDIEAGAGDLVSDAVFLSIPFDGGVPDLGGAIGGVQWHVTENPTATLNADGTGTFSGRDAASDVEISGVFTCPATSEPEPADD